jgi:disulfide bond formation protein DsbB
MLSGLKQRYLAVPLFRDATTPFLPVLRQWPIFAVLASAAMLAIAHSFETFGGLAPCNLCLKAREVYWVALCVGLVGVLMQRFTWATRTRLVVLWLLAFTFLIGAGLGAFHAGVEWKWWPGPTTCTGGSGVTAADITAMLGGAKVKPPACDKAAWVFLGLSMAGWNALISLGLAKLSFMAAIRATIRQGAGQ